MERIKLGIIGAGHLGKIHIKLALELSDLFEVVGFYDLSEEVRQATATAFNIHAFESIEALIAASDAVDIVTPTISHFDCAIKTLRQSKHTFIEKPLTNTLEEAKKLTEMTREAQVTVQVGHVERFNPAFKAVEHAFSKVMFVETHRLAEFNPRGTDVSVVLDLMIHDLDIILKVVQAKVRKLSASGVAVISDTPDICNARIEFDNGCVANLTASRISLKTMRKSRFFQKDAYISVDFLEKKSEVVQITEVDPNDPYALVIEPGEGKAPRQLRFNQPEVQASNAILEELRSFAHAINHKSTPVVTVDDGYQALQVAYQILDQINYTNSIFAA